MVKEDFSEVALFAVGFASKLCARTHKKTVLNTVKVSHAFDIERCFLLYDTWQVNGIFWHNSRHLLRHLWGSSLYALLTIKYFIPASVIR